MWIKICGTTSMEDARASLAAGASALGFIFAPSPRRLEIPAASLIVEALVTDVETIGIFVDEHPRRVERSAGNLRSPECNCTVTRRRS